MARIQLLGYRCERCGHEWVPREGTEEPRVCPKCKSPYWDSPKKSYETFKDAIAGVLKAADKPLTWGEIREVANLPQRFPNNQWVRRMEADIGLVREKSRGTTLWKLN